MIGAWWPCPHLVVRVCPRLLILPGCGVLTAAKIVAQLNAAVHRIAVTQLHVHPPAQAYLMRLQATGKFKREALRVLKRRLVRVIFNLLHADLDQTGLDPSAALLPAHESAA